MLFILFMSEEFYFLSSEITLFVLPKGPHN